MYSWDLKADYFSIISHTIFQKSFEYSDLMLKLLETAE